jgi:hypothetical protein
MANAQDLLPLPVDTPYGNLTLKLMNVWQRIGQANLRLQESYRHWEQFLTTQVLDGIDHGSRHRFAGEEAVFMLRRSADELVALIWVLETRELTGFYPPSVKLDSISGALARTWSLTEPHRWLHDTLNQISNAHKHSFLQSDLNIVGAEEPCVAALAVDRNRLSQEVMFQNVTFASLADAFTTFVRDCFDRLKAFQPGLRD